jgi:ASC-1-like (ASCH) protein
MPKKYILLVREDDREIYNLIKSGEKKFETRAGGPKYQDIQKGDIAVFECGDDRFKKIVAKVEKFKSVNDMLKLYKLSDVLPGVQSADELMNLYHSFPGYDERLEKYGIIVFELK